MFSCSPSGDAQKDSFWMRGSGTIVNVHLFVAETYNEDDESGDTNDFPLFSKEEKTRDEFACRSFTIPRYELPATNISFNIVVGSAVVSLVESKMQSLVGAE